MANTLVKASMPDAARELRAPRYTSYPSALCFDTEIGVADWTRAVTGSAAANALPISLYMHLPFCASACFYCGCHRVIAKSSARHADYARALVREVEIQASLVGRQRQVLQIHFGGGTPNSFRPQALSELLQALRQNFALAADDVLEVALEADPRLASVDDVRAWRAAGFNRVSFGVQDISLPTQQAINRVQDPAHIAALTAAAQAAGFSGVNYDLVYGLPLQTPATVAQTLDFVVKQRPQRVAAFHYAHMPSRFKAQRVIDEQQLPDLDTRLQLRAMIADRLQQAGYVAIGLDHFALPDDSLARAFADGRLNRNFQGYTPLSDVDIIAMGASSISFAAGVYVQNQPDVRRYEAAVLAGELPIVRGYRLDDDDRLRADAIRDLMCGRGVSYARLARRHGADVAARLADAVPRLLELDPLGRRVRIHADGVEVLDEGRDMLRLLASAFDAHLQRMASAGLSRAA